MSSTQALFRSALPLLLTVAFACTEPSRASAPAQAAVAPEPVALTLGVYTTPREAYGKSILPAFKTHYQTKQAREVQFQESYLGSGAQARAIVGGFEADVAALSLEPDIDTIRQAGLITRDWKQGEHHGIVSRSVVVIGVRPGNPKGIRGWQDLAKPGVEVLTPNVRTSGGAMWNVVAIYGAALRGHAGVAAGDTAAATALLGSILKNVKILDRSGRDSMLTFERGVGDAIITYENEILEGQSKGQKYEYVIPESTVSIENPVAIVDSYVDRHGTRAAAEAFVQFLWSPEVQRAFAKHGYRPVVAAIENESRAKFALPTDLFTVRDLGDWSGLQTVLFAPNALYDQAIAQRQGGGQ